MATANQKKVIVIPCSGIGKALGSIGRDATYEVVDNLRKGVTETTCLALIVAGDEETLQLIKSNKCITVDGCPRSMRTKERETRRGRPSSHIQSGGRSQRQ